MNWTFYEANKDYVEKLKVPWTCPSCGTINSPYTIHCHCNNHTYSGSLIFYINR